MNELPSTEFRKRFARLTKQTVVTVNGHPLGIWVPAYEKLTTPEGTHVIRETRGLSQAQRDELLRRINRR